MVGLFVYLPFEFTYASPSLGQAISPKALYFRCYSDLTGYPPDFESPMLKNVVLGKVPALRACEELLSSIRFDKNENSALNLQSEEALRVVNLFHDLHTSWFNAKSIPATSNGLSDDSTKDVYDPSEPALYFTRALFHPNLPVRSTVTSDSSLRTIRNGGQKELGPYSGMNIKNDSIYTQGPLPAAEQGELIGIVEQKEVSIPFALRPTDSAQPTLAGKHTFFRHFGGGILGSPSYMLNSFIMSYDFQADGGIYTPRIWAGAVMHDLLCRNLPVLRPEDVTSYVAPQSSLSYRKEKTCLRCHSTVDQMAGVLRGVHYEMSPLDLLSGITFTKRHSPYFISFFSPHMKSVEGWASEPDEYFKYRPPNGRLLFRNFRGELIDKEVFGLADLGETLARQDDFYMCIASRYYSYFTGINLEIADPIQDDLDEATRNAMQTIGALARNLKHHQSLKKTILEILKLPEYARN